MGLSWLKQVQKRGTRFLGVGGRDRGSTDAVPRRRGHTVGTLQATARREEEAPAVSRAARAPRRAVSDRKSRRRLRRRKRLRHRAGHLVEPPPAAESEHP